MTVYTVVLLCDTTATTGVDWDLDFAHGTNHCFTRFWHEPSHRQLVGLALGSDLSFGEWF